MRICLHLDRHSEGLASTYYSISELLWLYHLSLYVNRNMLLLGSLKERLVKAWLVSTRKISLGLKVLLDVLLSVIYAHLKALARESGLNEGLLQC